MKIEFDLDTEFRLQINQGDPYSETYVRLYDCNGRNVLQTLFGTPEVLVSVSNFNNGLLRCINKIQNGHTCTIPLYLENKKLILFPTRTDMLEIRSKNSMSSNECHWRATVEIDAFINEVESTTNDFLEFVSDVNKNLREDPVLIRISEQLEYLSDLDST